MFRWMHSNKFKGRKRKCNGELEVASIENKIRRKFSEMI